MGKFSLFFFFLSLAIPQFGLLSHICSLRLSSGHSGQVLTLSMQPTLPCPAPSCWLWMGVSGLLLRWELWLGTYTVCFFFFSLSWLCCPLRFQNFPQTRQWEDFLLFGNFSSFTTRSPGWVSVPNSFVSLFVSYILSYLLLKRMRLPFWVPGVLRQRSEVVLWKLFRIQMIFWWIRGGEGGLPILFLHHLLNTFWQNKYSSSLTHCIIAIINFFYI